jgi:glycosyltransferase involved in cell wall biosynthesis
VIASLEPGGAERVLATLLAALPRERFELHLAVFAARGRLLAELPAHVRVHDLQAHRLRRAPLRLRRLVRELAPDLVFSTLGYVNLLLLGLRPLLPRGTPLVVRESIEVTPEIAASRLPWFWSAAYRRLYPRADAIVCPARSMIEDLAGAFAIERALLHWIPNPIDVARVRRLASAASPYPGAGPHVVALGRLDAQKGFDLVIEAAARMRRPCELWILGEGAERPRLEARAAALGLAGRVHLPGHVPDPYPWLSHANAFALSSRYEGLPNALLEALACGARAAAFDAPGGIREIAEEAGGVRLVAPGDVGALARALDALVDPGCADPSPELPERYRLERVVGAYQELFERVAARARARW